MARRRLPLAGSDVSNYDIIRDCEGALALIAGGSSAGALLFESRMNRVQLVITVDSGAIGAAQTPSAAKWRLLMLASRWSDPC
jgi:hypothetical protein